MSAATLSRSLTAEQLLLDGLHDATRAVRSAVEAEAAEEGLTACQFWTLHHIVEQRRTRARALADVESVTPATVSVAVDHLVRAGLVDRRTLVDDRRGQLLEPTVRGRRLSVAIWGRLAHRFAARLSDVSRAELETTAEVLHRLVSREAETGRTGAPA